jgi:hypothetical protein
MKFIQTAKGWCTPNIFCLFHSSIPQPAETSYLSSKLFVFQMECGIPRYAAQQHTVSQVLESEVTNVNETLMQEGTRNSTGKIFLRKYHFKTICKTELNIKFVF